MMRTGSVPVSEISKLPYVKRVPTDGRIVFLLPYYDAEARDWVLNLPVAKNQLGRLAGGEPVVSSYLATRPANPSTDYPFMLGTFVAQHLSFQGVAGALSRIEADIYQFCAVLEKYHLIAEHSRKRQFVELLYASELEYLVVLVRSVYDLLQKLSKHAAALVHSLDAPRRRLIADLPDRFSQIVLHGDQPVTAEGITKKFGLPGPLAKFYEAESARFQILRDLRDSIEHHGETIPTIFQLEEGAAVSTSEPPWSSFPIWKPELLHKNNLGSLRLLFAHLIAEALEMTARYTAAYATCVAIPGALSDGIHLFLRHPFSHHLISLDRVLREPWERTVTER
jgi:hypothetical protein